MFSTSVSSWLSKGDVIGIDFGLAFGFATTTLPLPELVPFRLSPQFQNLIPGLGAKGGGQPSN